MPNVFIEPLPKGRAHPQITGYAVEMADDHVLQRFSSRQQAIEWSRANGHIPYVARVRSTDKHNPDHWQRL
jgi:hypothetical protein